MYRISLILFILLPLMNCSASTDSANSAKHSDIKLTGHALFEKYCQACHGDMAKGTDNGPPLVHPNYIPSHHGDGAFFRAALSGVKQHHWSFGDMPAVKSIQKVEIAEIIKHVRQLQRQAGLN